MDYKLSEVLQYEPLPEIQQLVAYIVLQHPDLWNREETNSINAIAFMRRQQPSRLPHYMVPACLEVLDDLPTLPSGKVDRKRLPQPQQNQTATPRENILLPSNATEEIITNIWQKLFPDAQISVEDNFFLDCENNLNLLVSPCLMSHHCRSC